LRASEYSALLQSIDAQYGSGARGQLNRIGQEAFGQDLALDPVGWNLLSFTNRFLPVEQRAQRSLEQLARQIAEPDGKVSVKREGEQLIVTDETSDGTYGRKHGHEICWQTIGEIQECVRWATGHSHEVTEVACQAKGDAACTFVIGQRLD
jgi:predicted hydrocarbon binding protein